MRRLNASLVGYVAFLVVAVLCSGCAKALSADRGEKLKLTFSGILLFEENDSSLVHFPNGKDFEFEGEKMPHHAFARFRQDDWDYQGPTPGSCSGGYAYINLTPTDKITLDGIEEDSLRHSWTFYEGLPLVSEGVLQIANICDHKPTINPKHAHAVLTVPPGELYIDRRTKDQWRFKPGPNGRGDGGNWRLVNRIGLRTHLKAGNQLTIDGIKGQRVVFKLKKVGKEPEIAFGNAPKQCLTTPTGTPSAKPKKDKHFELYYLLLVHPEPHHAPWGKLIEDTHTVPSAKAWEGWKMTEEGGGCPPLAKRP
jgi:hypothetical protein